MAGPAPYHCIATARRHRGHMGKPSTAPGCGDIYDARGTTTTSRAASAAVSAAVARAWPQQHGALQRLPQGLPQGLCSPALGHDLSAAVAQVRDELAAAEVPRGQRRALRSLPQEFVGEAPRVPHDAGSTAWLR